MSETLLAALTNIRTAEQMALAMLHIASLPSALGWTSNDCRI